MNVTPLRPDSSAFASQIDRIPPQNLEAEMALLGSVLVDREMMDVVAEILSASDFYAAFHETIYLALFALHGRGEPLDKVSLAEELKGRGMLDKIGGIAYLNSLMDTVPTASSAEYYARLVRDKATFRGMIHAGTQLVALGYDDGDVTEALSRMEQAVATVNERGNGSRPFQTGAVLTDLRAEMLSDDPVRVTLSPWKVLNDAIAGFTEGELVAIVAPAKIGKTGFAVTLSEYIAESTGPVPFFATEMGDRGIERRRIALRSGVSARRQRLKLFRPGERARAARAAADLAEKRMFVFGREHRSLRAIWRACRDIRKRFGQLGGICIDHIGFVEEARNFGKSVTETQALDVVYREMLNIADHFACPTFVVVHPNRDGSMERPSRKTLQQIRGGGALENHAHTILCPWRAAPEEAPEVAELVVVAARDGGEGAVPFHYKGARGAWMEMDGDNIVPLWIDQHINAAQLALEPDAGADDSAEDDPGLAGYAREMLGDDEDPPWPVAP